MPAIFVYITAASRDDAFRIGRALVEERLAACANVFDGMTSVYRWEGAVQQDQEAVLIAKTTQDRFEALAERVRELHSYDCPCIVSWAIGSGNPPYLEWIERESRA